MTPFHRLFGRPMRTKLSLLNEQSVNVSCKARQPKYEYSKRWISRIKNYKPGDKIIFRKGKQSSFQYSAVVSKRVGRYSYEIILDDGSKRIYNQCDLKLNYRKDMPNTSWIPGWWAYDNAQDTKQHNPMSQSQDKEPNIGSSPNVKDSKVSKYKLRHRSPNLYLKYKE
jgi:hypothetical protein